MRDSLVTNYQHQAEAEWNTRLFWKQDWSDCKSNIKILSDPETATQGSQPVLEPASLFQFDGQLAADNEWEGKDEGKGDKNIHF